MLNMAKKWCLLKKYVDEFKKGLKSGEIDPVKLSAMTSAERRKFLSKYVGDINAEQVNGLFESKLLLKNQKSGYISWAKKVAGITPQVRQDMISKIEKLDKVLDPKEEQAFLEDLVATKLGINVTEQEAKNIFELSKANQEAETSWQKELDSNPKWSENPFATRKEWLTNETRLKSGMTKVQLENYINELKLQSKKISFKEQPIKKITQTLRDIPGVLKSTVASFDNSFWGRQGIKTLLDIRTSKIWFRNFLKSWKDIGKQIFSKGKIWKSGDDAALDSIKADIYSRPNAINGKYRAGGYGLDVLSEEAYPSSLPEKIPLLGRVFKASEVAYNGGALRLRADLADMMIKKAEDHGVNTLGDEAKALGHLVGSMTGRGSLGKAEPLARDINNVLFSIKFMKSNFDTLTAHLFDPKVRENPFARKEAAKKLLSIVATLTTIFTIAKILNPDGVDTDPRSSKFGKIKMFGRWFDITGGLAGMTTLFSRVLPTYHNGELSFWKKDNKGEFINLTEGGYGKQNAWDILIEGLISNKLSPIAGLFRDKLKGETFDGQPVNLETATKNMLPLSLQNYEQLKNEPNTGYAIGSMIMDALGFSLSSTIEPNLKTKAIPEGKKIDNSSFIDTALIYAAAFGTDPETAFNRIFSGQKIRRVTNGAIIVERMPVGESQDIKKKANANKPEVKLDHTIPLELGGDNSRDNLKLVTTSEWSSYTKVENALGKALEKKKISKSEAQKLITEFKSIKDTESRKRRGDEIIKKYK